MTTNIKPQLKEIEAKLQDLIAAAAGDENALQLILNTCQEAAGCAEDALCEVEEEEEPLAWLEELADK